MTRLDSAGGPIANGKLGASGAIYLKCPHCSSHNLDAPDVPRGDDGVQCLICHGWFSYSEIEARALATTREGLALSFPNLPLDPV